MKKNLTKLLALLGVFLFLGAGNASAGTVTYTNPENWSSVRCYLFDAKSQPVGESWPGALMTKNNSDGTFSFTVPDNTTATQIIFNNGSGGDGNQTADLSLYNNCVYTVRNKSNQKDENGLALRTISYDNTIMGWSNVGCYLFDANSQPVGKAWPGIKINGSNGIFSVNFYCPVPTNVIFNNNTSNCSFEQGTQTGDLTYSANKKYYDPANANVYLNISEYNGTQNQAKVSGNVVTWSNINIGNRDFSIKISIDGDTHVYATQNVNVGSEQQLSRYGDISYASSKIVNPDNYSGIYNVSFNISTKKITLTEVANYPDKMFIIGGYNENSDLSDWKTNVGLEPTSINNGKYTWKGVKLLSNNYIGFATLLGDNWNVLNTSNRYGASEDNAILRKGVASSVKTYEPNKSNDDHTSAAKSWKVEKSGLYNVELDLSTNQIKITLLEPTGQWDIYAKNSNGNWTSYPLTRKGNTCIYEAAASGLTNGQIYVRQYLDDNQYYLYKAIEANTTLNSSNPMVELIFDLYPGNDCNFNGLSGTTNFVWNTATYKLSLDGEESTYPSNLYLYGHIQGGSWDRGNYAELMQNPERPGVFNAVSVVIEGEWNEWDEEIDRTNDQKAEEDKHKRWESCGDECYVAFFESINEKEGFERKGSNVLKLGSLDYENTFSPEYSNYQVIKGTAAKFDKQVEYQRNNFVVPKGVYDVEVNFDEGTVKFTESSTEETSHYYRWYYGNDNDKNTKGAIRIPDDKGIEGGVAHHTIEHKDLSYKGYVQVGCVNNPKHNAARQADFYVWYTPNSTSANRVKAKVGENKEITSSTTDEELNAMYDGYQYIGKSHTETLNEEEVTSDGGNNWEENHFLQLNLPGNYIITAVLSDDAKNIPTNFNVLQSTLYATVEKSITPIIDEESLRKAFNPYGTGDITFEDAFTFAEADLGIGNDIEISITPAKNIGGEWLTGDNTELDGYASFGGNAILDGYYVEGAERVSEPTLSGNQYNFSVNVPCSGIYLITLKSTDPVYKIVKNQAGDEATYQIVIYPNLYAAFGDNRISGFYVDQFDHGVDGNERHEVWYGNKELDALKENNGGIATATTPGTYFATLAINGSNGNGVKGKRNVSASSGNVDLRNLDNETATDSRVSIVVTPSKNGASEPYAFDIVTKASETLGVEGIGVEDGEAVYYNLQGVKVQNPEHGIYVKVQNGKAEKVVL